MRKRKRIHKARKLIGGWQSLRHKPTGVCTGDQVTVEDLPDRVLEHTQPGFSTQVPTAAMTPTDVSLEDIEKQHIRHVLSTASTLEEAAGILGINLSTLWRKRRRYSLE
jgi:NtrC-family two-component system response regulator AlgB